MTAMKMIASAIISLDLNSRKAKKISAPTPFDRVIELLEITADDEPLIEGRGPTVVVEYEVEFGGQGRQRYCFL